MDAGSKPQRRPFRGSCHCGAVKYVVYLTVPRPPPLATPDSPPPADRIYRCNCRICHKSGIMHVRPAAPAHDFALLSPVDPFASLGDYQCRDKQLHFFFCRRCGVRCFVFMGEGHVVEEARLGDEFGNIGGGQTAVQIWQPRAVGGGAGGGGNAKRKGCYLSVNGHTIDAGQQGFDMREWVEEESVMYYDFLRDDEPAPGRYGKPHPGGCY